MLKEKSISKKNGIKAEDSAVIAQAASRFKSDIYIIKGNKKVNAKSLMGLLSLNMKFGESVYISAEGPDEKEACEKLIDLL
ncbi:MAG: HPr family phosphocarrier protein [Bacillota bacterium]|jgi:phosphotransferase system HPr (HPr) family protein|nr:HPr family phosphocarrier protein [Bacillota bacterium]HHU42760.1 HPr family phosphocarrier protein [Clostridiales bacterium]